MDAIALFEELADDPGTRTGAALARISFPASQKDMELLAVLGAPLPKQSAAPKPRKSNRERIAAIFGKRYAK